MKRTTNRLNERCHERYNGRYDERCSEMLRVIRDYSTTAVPGDTRFMSGWNMNGTLSEGKRDHTDINQILKA